MLWHLRGDERGQGLVEYALIISLVAMTILLALPALGVEIVGIFESLDDPFV